MNDRTNYVNFIKEKRKKELKVAQQDTSQLHNNNKNISLTHAIL